MAKILEKIKNFFRICACKSKRKEETKLQPEEPKREEKPKEQK